MGTEDGIPDLFDRATQGLNPAVDDIVARGETAGRRLRRRRRTRIAVGNTVLLGAVAGIAVAVGTHQPHQPAPTGLTGTVGSPTASATPRTTATSSAMPPPTSPPTSYSLRITVSPTETAAAPPPTTPALLTALWKLLPAGSSVSDVRVDQTGTDTLEVDYDDGHGTADLMLSIMPTRSLSGIDCPTPLWPDEGPRPAGALPESCRMRTLPSGDRERDAVMYADSAGFYGYSVYDERPAGYTVFLQVGNGTLHGLPKVTRADPPGTMAEWETVAENPLWTP